MKIQVLGVKRISGIAKESGNPFEMCTLLAVVPIEQVSGKNFSVQGYGYEVGELDVDPDAVKQFEGHKYPCVMELNTETVMGRNNKLSQIVTGTTTQVPVKSVSNG